jgi:hypothetical protein
VKRLVGRPLGVEDMPAELRSFVAEGWLEPCLPDCGCDPWQPHGYRSAHERWSDARASWCREQGVSLLDVMREDARERFGGPRWWLDGGDDAA